MKKRVESDLRTDFYLRIEAGKDVDEVIKEDATKLSYVLQHPLFFGFFYKFYYI